MALPVSLDLYGSPSADASGAESAGEGVRVCRLALRNFRNVARADLAIPEPGVVLVGGNGHGKTNVLEAMHYAHAFRSERTARDSDLIAFGADTFHLAIDARGAACQTLSVGVGRGGVRKKIVVDGIQVQRVVDALGAVSSVILSPSDVGLVAGPPSERRRYLDVALGTTSHRYVSALQTYRSALQQRNAAIREAGERGRADAGARLAMWEPALAESGAQLWADRSTWASWAAERLTALCDALGERAPVTLSLATARRDAPIEDTSVERLRGELGLALARDRSSDLRRGLTQSGPHRDDLVLALGGRSLRSFGSAGQQRCAATALRLIERDTVLRRSGRLPSMLLDDPFAELDADRARRMLRLVCEGAGQVILAVPRADDVPDALTPLDRWEVRDGVISC